MSKKNDLWMPLYLGDYLADTMHLNAEQHGMYLLLIMHYWRSGPLPNNESVLRQISKCPPENWPESWPMVKAFFSAKGGKLIHGRVEKQKARQQQLTESRAAAARAKWGKK